MNKKSLLISAVLGLLATVVVAANFKQTDPYWVVRNGAVKASTGSATNLSLVGATISDTAGNKLIDGDNAGETRIYGAGTKMFSVDETGTFLFDESGLLKLSITGSGNTISNGVTIASGGALIYGDQYHTNAVYIGAGGETLSNSVGSVTISGGTVSASSRFNGNGAGLTNLAGSFVIKTPFSTNYTVLSTDTTLACSGTNQVITLPNGTNGIPAGKEYKFLVSSTTGDGSVVITNANGVQQILSTALSLTLTNGQRQSLMWDGVSWR